MADLVFVSLGDGNTVCANNIYAVMPLKTAQSRAILKRAKTDGSFLDWTGHRTLKSLVFLGNGKIIGCFFSAATVFKRLNLATGHTVEDDMEANEDED